MLFTMQQLSASLARTAAYCKEIDALNNGRAMEFAPYFGGVMKKYGIILKTQNGVFVNLGGDWTIEFFIQFNFPLSATPEVPSIHFILTGAETSMVLALSKDAQINSCPCESFFLGDISLKSPAIYFDSLETTLADGELHHVYIEHSAVDEAANILIYIDGNLVIANKFDKQITCFRTLVFGAEAFIGKPVFENFAVFDAFRVLASCRYLSALPAPKTIEVPTENFFIDDDTLILYQNGMLNLSVNDEAAETE